MRLEKTVAFQVQEVTEVPNWANTYAEHKFSVYRCCFLSTRPNSHEIPISEEILRKYAPTILGSFLVAHISNGDATTHTVDEIIYGYAPKEQEVEFVEDGDYTKAYCYFVVSKRYSKEFNGIFEFDNLRDSSVEMAVEYADDGETVAGLDIYGLTCLGKRINGSCPDADIKMVRFSKKTATSYFMKKEKTNLQKFVEERKTMMAEQRYKIDKFKEAMSDADWGAYDKNEMRDKIMEATNRDELVKEVYALVEDGWEDAPSEHLKYPLMILDGDTFVYNRTALSSALAYAKQHKEQSVIDKVEKIYKDFDLDDSDGKEEKKMSEVKFSAVDIGHIWGAIRCVLDRRSGWIYDIEGLYEEDNKKFAILKDSENKLYRLDFSLTEDGLTVANELVEVKPEFLETDRIVKFEKCECEHEEETNFEKECEELKARLAALEKDIEDKNAIIMGNEEELAELRKFKADIEDKEKALSVESIMAEVKDYVDEQAFNDMRKEGLACNKDDLDGWANSVKATAFASVKKQNNRNKNNLGVWNFSAPVETEQPKKSKLWD